MPPSKKTPSNTAVKRGTRNTTTQRYQINMFELDGKSLQALFESFRSTRIIAESHYSKCIQAVNAAYASDYDWANDIHFLMYSPNKLTVIVGGCHSYGVVQLSPFLNLTERRNIATAIDGKWAEMLQDNAFCSSAIEEELSQVNNLVLTQSMSTQSTLSSQGSESDHNPIPTQTMSTQSTISSQGSEPDLDI
ncbi:hypothetical protein FRC02_003355 [Tulasnella sp. 418]|nr:hypothetical protein FRC02_003355 [Tulasnella sp. 418]